ncbi:PucR family transcriptional regulator [Pseudonocardia asaccharolytica]|uniref:PucR family transcriptional regulator n=1 Tax=Pseudonocardia asaccharolytica TaxID=54010 RepID=UPI000421D6FF|nr:PucR family transcriptional regulator [Pseudonocardia asaccharolytica]
MTASGVRPRPAPTTVSAATLRRLERAAGEVAGACLAAMVTRQPWFARLPADQRAGVQLVTQTGVANFVAWLGQGNHTAGTATGTTRLTAEAFRIAPRGLARQLTLCQTVELVRIATDVLEQRMPPLAADGSEFQALSEAVLRFGREVAFAAATAYAGAAEDRGAWDARLEALVVDGVVRGDGGDELVSRASALGWNPSTAVRVLVGAPPRDNPPERLGELRRSAVRMGRSVLVGAQGSRLIVLLSEQPGGGADTDPIGRIAEDFGPGPIVVGPVASDLTTAYASARDALAGLRAVAGWPQAPRPVDAEDLLPERAMSGDPAAHRRLVEAVVTPLTEAGGELLRTLAAYLEGGAALEACARALFVHPNTVRYRLRRVSELTGRSPMDPRDSLVLRTALVVGRLQSAGGSDEPPESR